MIRNTADTWQVIWSLLSPVFVLVPFFVSSNSAYLDSIIWLGVWILICRNNYILHNHVHCPFLASRWLNRLISLCLGFTTGMTSGCWKITHIHGHHVKNPSTLERVNKYSKRFRIGSNGKFSRLSATLHAVATAPIQWVFPLVVMVRGLYYSSGNRRSYYLFYLLEFGIIYAIVAALFVYNPLKATFYFGLTYLLVFIVSRHVDYVTHISDRGVPGIDAINVCPSEVYNKFLWNFGFHMAHHLYPSAHWTRLPSIQDDLDLEWSDTPVAQTTNWYGLFWPMTFPWYSVRIVEK